MRTLLAIGIGTGNPQHLTLQAVEALRRVDVVFSFDKGEEKEDLVQLRRELCERFIPPRPFRMVEIADAPRDAGIAGYEARVDAWHERRVVACEESVARELGEGQTGAILVWGDPSLYDSTLRLLERLQERGRLVFEYSAIAGISSPQALAASHRLILNRVGGAVHITTGRRLLEAAASGVEDILVMLDGGCAFKQLPAEDYDIYWGAYLGSDREIAIAGPLAERGLEIERARAAARTQHGWIMDTYLLRRRSRPTPA